MLRALLVDAIDILVRYPRQPGPTERQRDRCSIRGQTVLWVEEDAHDATAFLTVCELLALDPMLVRAQLRARGLLPAVVAPPRPPALDRAEPAGAAPPMLIHTPPAPRAA